MNKVNVVHIGPQKSGSTWLYEAIREHPEVSNAQSHSVHYFDLHYQRGVDWYSSHFKAQECPVTLDSTPSYLRSPFAPQRIHDYNPDAKIILVARNPLERAFSHYWHEKKKGQLNFGFEEVIANYDLFASWIETGLYAYHLNRYLAVFPASQVHVLLYDDLKESPEKFFIELCDICAIDRNFVPDVISRRVNEAARFRGKGMRRILNRTSRVKSVSRVLSQAYDIAFDTQIETLADVDKALKQALLDVFIPDIEELEKFLARDLSSWKELT